jgi:GNAT superfamily N-acetyltransferase
MPDLRIRAAVPTDHPTFVELVQELGVDDPIPSLERFCDDLMPSTVIAERDGLPVGYAVSRCMSDTLHVAHVVSAPSARRTGVGRALFDALVERARASGCGFLQLNVKPTNVAAIRLYESFGLAQTHTNLGLKIEWAVAEAKGDAETAARARSIEPEDDAALEVAWSMPSGMLAEQRARPNRVLRMIEVPRVRPAMGVFDRGFPGVYPFHAHDAAHALALLRALRPFAPENPLVFLMIENQTDLGAALVSAGADLRMETVFMRGPVAP